MNQKDRKKAAIVKAYTQNPSKAILDTVLDNTVQIENLWEMVPKLKVQPINGQDGKDGYTPIKGVDYFDGKDGESIIGPKGDPGESIIGPVGPRGPKGEDGKDADATQIVEEVLRLIPSPTPPDAPLQLREKLESLPVGERLRAEFIDGLPSPQDFVDYFEKLDQGVKNRVIGSNFLSRKGPVDQRWHGGGSSGTTLELEVNGTPNVDQTLLNLIAGTNITLTDNGAGGVTIDATGGGGSQTLAQTLALGNVTGGTDIVVSTGDQIIGQTDLLLSAAGGDNFYYAGPSYIFQQWYNGVNSTDFLLQGGGTQLYSDTGIDIQSATGLYGFFEGTAFNGTFDFTNLTGNQTYDWPDQSGTVALLSDIPAAFITAVGDTDTVDLTVTGTTLTADVITQMSITSDASGLKLSGDAATPGNSKYYGTDGAGTKGFFSLPTDFITAVADTNTINLTVSTTTLTADLTYVDSATINFSDSVSGFTGVTIQQMSITADASGLKLVNDATTPGASQYYGTNSGGTKGFFALPSATPGGADTQVQFNDAGSFGGDADFTWNKTSNALAITGTITTSGAIRSNTSFIWEETGVGTDIITIQAPASIASSYTLTLPVDDGGSNQFLQTDGAGVLTWATALTSLSIGQAITSGAANRVLYENASNLLDEDAGFTFTEATNTLGIGEVGNGGEINLLGGTSGVVTIQTAAAAGTWSLTLPTTGGSANFFLQTNGSGTSTWAAAYFPGGTDVALADGGTGASLSDPNADRILFWDDSAGSMDWLTVGSGLSISTTTLSATVTGYPTRLKIPLVSFGAAGTEPTAGKYSSGTTPATPTGNNILYIDLAASDEIVFSFTLPDYFPTGADIKVRLVYSSTVAAGSMSATLDGSSNVLDPVGNNAVSANMAYHDNDASVSLTVSAANTNKTFADTTFEVTNSSGVFDDGSDADVTSAAGQVINTRIVRTDSDTELLRIYSVEADWT